MPEPTTQHNVVGFLNPREVVKELPIEPGMKIADFGCGSGYFAFAFAEKTGIGGKIYAIDVLPTALESVRSQAKLRGLYNIEPLRADLETPGSTKLADESCDLVFIANVLFQSQKKSEIVAEAKRILKSGGALIFIEWRPDAKIGPPAAGYKITTEEIQK
ncbi:MAG: class I SAM-dependent methyltransferase, partial [Candidatus Roizmanbacteria bacterium]|nr:class I SAM-dependent methyltransferase [Candidatus Roizmanbacteria bacterium]